MLKAVPRATLPRLVAIALAAAASVGLGCGGGSDTTVTTATAVFTPDTASPGAATIALLPGTSTGASVTVRVTATGIPSFFGAAFRITFDNTALQFNSMADATSFLRTGVTDADVLFMADSTSTSGEVVITATRINPDVAPPVAVTTTADLVVLTFTARKVIVPLAAEGRVDFSAPMQVCDGTPGGPACNPVTVTWSAGGISAQ